MSNLYCHGLEIVLMFSYSRMNVNVKASWNLQVYLISKKLCYEELSHAIKRLNTSFQMVDVHPYFLIPPYFNHDINHDILIMTSIISSSSTLLFVVVTISNV